MKLTIYQVDAFAGAVFSGNPAAVCPLTEWLNETLMQQIAMENNLAETTFYVFRNDRYEIRWFTPAVEVDLCGHATLAAAHVLFSREGYTGESIRFYSHRSGELTVTRKEDWLTLNFPTDELSPVAVTDQMKACFGITPLQAFKGKTDYMFVFSSEADILNLKPQLNVIKELPGRGVIATAPGNQVDFVSRFFAPQSGIDEDPVTGSAHTSLTPYWSKALGKTTLSALQLSPRKGVLNCEYLNERVEISGQAKLYLAGEIYV